MKFKTFLLLFLFISNVNIAGEGDETTDKSQSLEILVIDGATEEPIPAAKVKIVGLLNDTYTDFDGLAKVENISIGSYELEVTFLSYEKYTVKALQIHPSSNQLLVKLYP